MVHALAGRFFPQTHSLRHPHPIPSARPAHTGRAPEGHGDTQYRTVSRHTPHKPCTHRAALSPPPPRPHSTSPSLQHPVGFGTWQTQPCHCTNCVTWQSYLNSLSLSFPFTRLLRWAHACKVFSTMQVCSAFQKFTLRHFTLQKT